MSSNVNSILIGILLMNMSELTSVNNDIQGRVLQ